MRRIEVACLAPNGDIEDFTRIVPAVRAFDQAFSAFARGGLVTTDRGTVAIEDLIPGDRVKTVTGGFRTLLWRGSTMLVADARGQEACMGRLTRISADALGIARPQADLVLGPWARLVHRAPGVKTLTGHDLALVPAADFFDGVNVIALTPPSPQQVFHLGFEGHERIVVNGVEVESYHPGPLHALGLSGEYLQLWLSLFPHMEDLADFGPPALPRVSRTDLDLIDVA